ncbi:MAG: hypothetical protein J7J91_10000 [Deltaproteobacteria bacterium]|nr:hypothetical protein [Deltaproteobacteria bacterium]MCD6138874.1 hypothetical protein [Deltaproteobacteria bacterium]RLB88013.1 MAG: hypothetical protein DRH10_08285 [Deltaproteobacteria bacterium]RLB88046.1 MAG: hypothetical protein DRH50_15855 [Deltaproteobacteria bacterium]RLC07764.1 MAG: hypothetical protein DRH43_11225 [Deltaproteobacteria bacterium]
MARLTIKAAEELLQKEVQKMDRRARVSAVSQGKKKDRYRVTIVKDARYGSVDLKKELIKECLSRESKGSELRKVLGKAVSQLSIKRR